MNDTLKKKWERFLAENIIADCTECQRQYTVSGTNNLVRLRAAEQKWSCGCGGIVLPRSAEQIERQRRHWINNHMRN